MLRSISFFIVLFFAQPSYAENMIFSTSNSDYQITNTFSNVNLFNIQIEINSPLAVGVYNNPEIVSVSYRVYGILAVGTPSDFPSFDLRRRISGAEFYAQGSSLSFEISPSAVLEDGIQASELIENDSILIFNGREVNNGRYHPAILELNADGTGRIQNSNNQVNILETVDFGEEYITDLAFIPSNTTLITEKRASSGGGSISLIIIFALFFCLSLRLKVLR